MKSTPHISTVMSPCPHRVLIDDSIAHAVDMMRKHRVRHLPVLKGEKLIGIVSERDITFGLALSKKLTISEVYTPEPFVVSPKEPLDKVAAQMAEERFGCALVMDKDKLVGIFTTTDACRVLASIVAEAE
jgi:acetoin utilization protein AcuB